MISGSDQESRSISQNSGPGGVVLPAPQALGRYRLCAELSSGGMGTVYLARAEGPGGFGKWVALKHIHAHLAKDAKFVAMFLDEARIAARIHHPNVCSAIDFGEVEGTYYLTMPFLEGEPLSRVCRALAKTEVDELRAAAPFVLARLVADACEGLHAAHELTDERGEPLAVVHRDVSPQNLFVGFGGTLSVLDFGVASARHRLYSTATGEVKGKFAYICPEQLESRDVDRRADIWSLGVVLWEGLALRRLFGKSDMAATVRAVLHDPIPSLRELRPDVPLGLEEVVFKALSRDRERRYATARDMGKDLLTVLAEEGRVIGPGDVSEWLDRVMPEARAEKRRMLDAASAPSVAAPPNDEPPTVRAAPAGRRRTPLLAALVVLGLAIGGVATYLAATSGERAEPAIARAETRSTEMQPAEPAIAPIESQPRERPSPEEPPEAPIASAEEPPPDEPVPSADPAAPSDDAPASDEPRARRGRTRGEGTVTIATPGGWAIVYAGRRRLGETPGTFRLPAGSTLLQIQPFGRGARIRRRVQVPADGTVRVSVPVR